MPLSGETCDPASYVGRPKGLSNEDHSHSDGAYASMRPVSALGGGRAPIHRYGATVEQAALHTPPVNLG